MFKRKPKIGQIWFDNCLNKRFIIYGKFNDKGVYKPFDVLYENNQTRYLTKEYVNTNCKYVGVSKIVFEDLFKVKGEDNNE